MEEMFTRKEKGRVGDTHACTLIGTWDMSPGLKSTFAYFWVAFSKFHLVFELQRWSYEAFGINSMSHHCSKCLY